MDMKNLSSRQVHWAQKLSRYHFWIDYRQSKANVAADALSRFFQRSQDEQNELRAENSKIFHRLQNSLTNISLARLSFLSSSSLPSYLHQVLIWGTYVLPQLRKFWNLFQSKLSSKSFYTNSISGIKLRLHNCRPKTSKPGTPEQSTQKARITLTVCCTTKTSPTSQKLSGQNLSAGIMTTH